ncbi:hypothetical protein EVAR_31364_1 [Eumeta japonica]|uniref:Uncharacterized protein n=1 Tax=Eumeta variegata TaxID=151549 RepID=A0A4C1XAA6_EUMVA|nr:hypothetical protein EVAR_31364_1 [Eumeta japonica]
MKRRRRCTKQASLSALGCFPSSSGFSVGRCTRTDTFFRFFLCFSLRGRGIKKLMYYPRTRVRGECPTLTDQKTPEATCWLAVVRSPNKLEL